jgi:hypothetical protein
LQEEEQRLEEERLRQEEEEQRRFEEEQLRLVEEARRAEEERLLQAIQVTIFMMCILLCITIRKSDRITVTTTKTSRFLFIFNLASLLHVSVSQRPSSGS